MGLLFRKLFLFESWLRLPGYALFMMLLVFPMVPELLLVKAGLFALLGLMVLIGAMRTGQLRIHPTVALWTLALAAMSMLSVYWGLILDAPGAMSQALVFVAFPCAYLVLVAGAARLSTLIVLHQTAVVATVLGGVYGMLYVLTQIGILPDIFFVDVLSQGRIGFHKGYLQFSLLFINSFPFLVPFSMAALYVATTRRERPLVPKAILWSALVVGLATTVVSGRRALWLVTAMAPLMILFFQVVGEGSTQRINRGLLLRAIGGSLAVLVAVGLVLRLVYAFDLARIITVFFEGFDLRRQEQLEALLEGWSQKPLLGGGHGSYVAAVIRSDAEPWNGYELSYLSLLYQTGAVGMLCYTAGVAWIYWMGVRILRDGGVLERMMFPTLIGLSGLLIANGTNPYLTRFDGWWVIFLPIALINFWMLERANGQGPPGSG